MVKIFVECGSINNNLLMERAINEWMSANPIIIEYVTTISNDHGIWILIFYRGKDQISNWELKQEILNK